jgi:hypothetical protein
VTPASTVKPLPGNGWWTNVALDPGGAVAVSANFENGAVVANASIEWSPFNILLETDVMLRVGDSLLLAAHPEGSAEGTASISVAGVTNFVISAAQARAVAFTQPGRHAVTAVFSGGGVVATNTLVVTVVGASVGDGVSAWMGKVNTVSLPGVPLTNVVVLVDSDIEAVSLGAVGTGIQCSLSVPQFDGARSLAVALPGASGSVLDSAPIHGFQARYTIDGYYTVAEVLEDGTRVIENRISVSDIPDDVSLVMTAFQAGVCYEDGSSKLVLAKQDFTALGECVYRLYAAPGVSNPCQFLAAYVGNLKIAQ